MKYTLIVFFVLLIAVLFLLKSKEKINKNIEKIVAEKNPKVDEFYLCFEDKYIAHSDELRIRELFKELNNEVVWTIGNDNRFYKIRQFKNDYKNLHEYVIKHNKEFVDNEIIRTDKLLSNIDGKSLDRQQREIVVSDEDHTLVVAGAGSGKTLTIASKVKYLCEVKKIKPEDILLLSFSKNAANEMNNRISKKYGLDVKASTFHALGLDVLKKTSETYNVVNNINKVVENYFSDITNKDIGVISNLVEYFAYYLQLPSDLEKYSSLGEVYDHEKSMDLETIKSKYNSYSYANKKAKELKSSRHTLNNEQVKSLQEVEIANFLFLHGVNYEYEHIYEYQEGNSRRIYKPDFYLPDYDIYIEHFGVNKNNECPWLSKVESDKYVEDMLWKRKTHKEHKTKLIETYSYYHSEGRLLSELEKQLLKNGVKFKDIDIVDVFNAVYESSGKKYFASFIEFTTTFISHFNSNGYSIDELDELSYKKSYYNNEFFARRAEVFKRIVKPIIIEYKKQLQETNSYDFSDMINTSAKRIDEGFVPHMYKYVIVDEYQDMSIARYRLLKKVIDVTSAKLLCVGDDWQSIYRFSGSDIDLFTSFPKYFGYTNTQFIEKTYRNSQQLIYVSGIVIMKNPKQIKKYLKSDKNIDDSIYLWHYEDKEKELIRIINKIIKDSGKETSILLLGRTSYDFDVIERSSYFKCNKKREIKYIDSPKTPIHFLTVHSAKGLEADNVVILNFENSTMGFPNKIADDPLLELVLSESDDFFYAEERRLFYVALTRARERAYILVDAKYPSEFKKDLIDTNICTVVGKEAVKQDTDSICPRCKTGYLVKRKNLQTGQYFVGCSNYPKCRYTIDSTAAVENKRICPNCGGFLTLRVGKYGPIYGCSNYPKCQYLEEYKDNHICPKCGSQLKLRKGPKGVFWGCSNYPNCTYTNNIIDY